MLICSHIIYGCFQNALADLSSCDRDIMTHSVIYLLSGSLQEKYADYFSYSFVQFI